MLTNSYLLVPACNEGNGTGHLRRMITLYRDLKKTSSVSIFITTKHITEILKNLLIDSVDRNDIYSSILPEDRLWDYIIVDYRNSPESLILNLQARGFLIGIDEGGTHRKYFNYLIDIIPSIGNSHMPNLYSSALMDLPQKRQYIPPVLYKKILISFGGEDPMSLTGAILEFINKNNFFPESEITIVGNINKGNFEYFQSVKQISKQNNLKNILKNYDLIFTSFGLTAFESLASGVPFILLNPSLYHKQLSMECGFFEIGIIKPIKKKLDWFIANEVDYSVFQDKFIPNKYRKLKDLIFSINKTETNCPVCKNSCKPFDILHRFETRNFYYCSDCNITFQVNYLPVKDSYKKEYFFEDYKKQYGRTYLEDFTSIQKLAEGRLKILNRILPGSMEKHIGLELLDVGCAYGPFLVKSSEYGFIPSGVEIIPEASEYVRSKFGFKVLTGTFENSVFEKPFNVITMWYVIEHFLDPDEVLSRVNKHLKMGGIFAFSTPNSTGISARRNATDFFKNSPSDHITIWNPKISPSVLKRYGFKIKTIRITGHHPERFHGYSGLKSKLGYNILNILSKLLKLGDTFEVYAVKIKEIDV